ncbi:hypothetical protein D3C74_477930 [compost metagenome]
MSKAKTTTPNAGIVTNQLDKLSEMPKCNPISGKAGVNALPTMIVRLLANITPIIPNSDN